MAHRTGELHIQSSDDVCAEPQQRK
ncbi:uncharacterized protein G2W53_023104 [Senna tora]|uniref:Uncharacterized protein n=1 Tax=Senna tora TaxID=362788 RepID=A0A834WJ24_9FABA|nr:uncharacterized protein G2W53_023104 [Senna tora]